MEIIKTSAHHQEDWKHLMSAYFHFYQFPVTEEHLNYVFNKIISGQNDGLHSFLAYSNQQVIGVTNFILMPDTFNKHNCYLSDLYTVKEYRGQSVARSLINHVEQAAKQIGCVSLYWLTAQDNLLAQKLYDKIATKTSWIYYEKTI